MAPGNTTGDILTYHELSKHHIGHYAPGPAGMDWANQPDPFRHFIGAPSINLPLVADQLATPFSALQQPASIPPSDMNLKQIAALFELSLALSAWKSWGDNRWALRCNPSSGNLHPIEAYLACPEIEGLSGGLHHYLSLEHALGRRFQTHDKRWLGAFHGNLLIGLSYIPWREAWKYGARAFRYCQLDLGHAIAALAYAASTLGWQCRLLTDPSDQETSHLLGIDRQQDFQGVEKEIPAALLIIGPSVDLVETNQLLNLPGDGQWQGQASRLSSTEIEWPAITQVIQASHKEHTQPLSPVQPSSLPSPKPFPEEMRAADLIRQRRSAQAFDGRTGMSKQDFFCLLDNLLPRSHVPPWNSLPWEAKVHPILFIHRIHGLEPGLYILARNPQAEHGLRQALRQSFLWQSPADCPLHLGLYLLQQGELQQRAAQISCFQEIASDSAFSLGMLADFSELDQSPHFYRHLYWEAGVLGQVLYLGAEASKLRGTGIGCFFDDEMHQLLGLKGKEWQIIYHFTLGKPELDPRLQSHPPYSHRQGS